MSLLPSSPYFPSSVSMFSNAGVSSGSNPYCRYTSRTTPMTYSRRRISAGRKSRVPDGGLVLGVLKAVIDVAIGVQPDVVDFLLRQQALDLARAAHHQRARRHLHVLGDERPRRDDGAGADARAVQQNRADADEALRFDRAAVDHRGMADRHGVADVRLVRAEHRVDDGAVLDVRPAADPDDVHVAAHHRAHPHAAL